MSVEFGSTRQLEDLERKLNELARTGLKQTVLDAIAKEMGVRAVFVNSNFQGIFPALQNGSFDVVISALTINSELSANSKLTDSLTHQFSDDCPNSFKLHLPTNRRRTPLNKLSTERH